MMGEPALLPGISYEEALEQIDEWQAYIASQHEAMKKQAEERRVRLEKRREEMLTQAKERQEKMIAYYESMYKKAQEQRKFLEENEADFMKEDLERQSGLSEYHEQMRKATEERRAELAAKRAELENMPLQDIRAYLADVRKLTMEDAKSLRMEGIRTPTPPPWPETPSFESRQGQYGPPGRGWQEPQFGPGGMDYPMGPSSEMGNAPFGDWGPRGGIPRGGFGGPGMRQGPMGNPEMGGPGMRPGPMGNPGMGMGGPGPQSSLTPGGTIGQKAAPVMPRGNAGAAIPEPVTWHHRPGGYAPARFGRAPGYHAPHPVAFRPWSVSAAPHPGWYHTPGWRPFPRGARQQLAWWPPRYVPAAVVAANRFGAHPFPGMYTGPRGPLQAGAYPARVASRIAPAQPVQRFLPAQAYAGSWPYRPFSG